MNVNCYGTARFRLWAKNKSNALEYSDDKWGGHKRDSGTAINTCYKELIVSVVEGKCDGP